MDRKPTIEWIQLEFFGSLPPGYSCLRYRPDGTLGYTCEGEELPVSLPCSHEWTASWRVYQYLARILLKSPWEQEIDPAGDDFMVCDGWTDTLSWSVNGEIYEYSVQIGVGPESMLKVIERMNKLLKDEGKKHPPQHEIFF